MDAASPSDVREWADRLRRAMVILVVSAVPLGAAVRFGELSVPAGTSQLEMWFENGDPMSPGTAWDSRYGSNYSFDVVQ